MLLLPASAQYTRWVLSSMAKDLGWQPAATTINDEVEPDKEALKI